MPTVAFSGNSQVVMYCHHDNCDLGTCRYVEDGCGNDGVKLFLIVERDKIRRNNHNPALEVQDGS